MFTLIFPENDLLVEILWFITNIFSLLPLLLGAYSAIFALNFGIVLYAHSGKSSSSTAYKIFSNSYRIYKNMLWIVSLIGFLLLGIKIAGVF